MRGCRGIFSFESGLKGLSCLKLLITNRLKVTCQVAQSRAAQSVSPEGNSRAMQAFPGAASRPFFEFPFCTNFSKSKFCALIGTPREACVKKRLIFEDVVCSLFFTFGRRKFYCRFNRVTTISNFRRSLMGRMLSKEGIGFMRGFLLSRQVDDFPCLKR